MTVDTHERAEDRVRGGSRPSELRITDLRTATVGWGKWHFTLVRIDTNQGLSPTRGNRSTIGSPCVRCA